jgi:acetolactate synthase-1/2/3 large subunit
VIPILSDPGYVIRRILECVPEISARVRARTLPPPMLVHNASTGAVHPADLMRWLGSSLPSDVVVHVDAGNGFSWSTRHLARSKPDTYRVAMGLSTMSWAIGATIGAAVGRRRRSVCVAGDGSMLMSSLELTVAVEQNLPVTYIVLNDSSYGMVRHGQRLGGAESIANAITPVRFDQLALACGASAVCVETFADLDRVPREFLSDDGIGCCLIDVRIDPDAVPPIGDRVSGLAAGVTR